MFPFQSPTAGAGGPLGLGGLSLAGLGSPGAMAALAALQGGAPGELDVNQWYDQDPDPAAQLSYYFDDESFFS